MSGNSKPPHSSSTGVLNPDRFFDPDEGVRRIARSLYEETAQLPIISPHGHVPPQLLAEDAAFPEPTALFVTPDHYIFRMLYSQGVTLEELGIPGCGGEQPSVDPRRVWQIFGDHYFLFRGTPTKAWMDYSLHEVFGIGEKLSADSAQTIYDQLSEKLRSPEFRPRALFDRFNLEVLATTDAATDDLRFHRKVRESGWKGKVVPTFRPDALFRIARPGWRAELESLEKIRGRPLSDFAQFIDALQDRRNFFRSNGATSTDHAVIAPLTKRLAESEAKAIFGKALDGSADSADQARFEAHMLMEMARMSSEDGLVMQLHAGAMRDHNDLIARDFGPDMGADIPVTTEFTRNLRDLLNAHGNDSRFRIVLFTLDESTYARELAPLAGHYPSVRLGPPWWFHDSMEGMTRFRQMTTETAGIYNTAGFNDDTRAFCSIPARHDLARRVDANWLSGLVARHMIDMPDAREMAKALAYDLAKETYRFSDPVPAEAKVKA